MSKIKDIPKIDRPRERFLKKGPEALSKSDLLAILLGSGIKGKNVQKLSQQIIKKFGKNFLNITIDDLQKISGIGQAKALQIVSALALVKRYYADEKTNEIVIKNSQDVLSLVYDLKDKKKEYLICLYLNARNVLLKKEIVSIGLLDKTLLHPREIFHPAIELNAASVILIHNHPSGDSSPSEKDIQIVEKIAKAGEIMGISVIDFIIISENEHHSFYEKLKNQNKGFDYVADGIQETLFDLMEIEKKHYNKKDEHQNVLNNIKKPFHFIDLFAGIGGFHIAANKLGGKCVFASEIDEKAKEVYHTNFYKKNKKLFDDGYFVGDIMKVDEKNIPKFDFLFAGFPCQPFSKGGYRKGFKDIRGTLFFQIARIVKYHRPSLILLENVSNLVTHDDGKTFRTITKVLDELGYAINLEPLILSPHYFGIPVIRQRIFIPAIRKDILNKEYFNIDFANEFQEINLNGIYDMVDNSKKSKKYYISEYEEKVLKVWDEFYKGIDLKIIGFPIWTEEFKKNTDIFQLPKWKQGFIIKNRNLYLRNKNFIDEWLKKWQNLNWMSATHKKLEWQAGKDIANIYEGLIQFRPSGVRVKRPDKFATLVAMNHPQIIGKFKRRLIPDETKKLQSFPDSFCVYPDDNVALKQLGNSINVQVAQKVIEKMLNLSCN